MYYICASLCFAIEREPLLRQSDAFTISIGAGPLFRGADVRKLAIGLRRRRAETSADLDPDATVEATSHNAGYFSPVAAKRTAEPEYLFMGERKNVRDHQARLHDELIRRLRRGRTLALSAALAGQAYLLLRPGEPWAGDRWKQLRA